MGASSILVASAGVGVATVGGMVALYNARMGVLWKRAELANTNLKELLNNEELVFACRCLDWNGGVLVVPKNLQPLLKDDAKTIEHDKVVYHRALDPMLYLEDMAADPRLQIYRTSTDTLLGWLSATESAIKRNLYTTDDVEEAGYWLRRAYAIPAMYAFVKAFDYDRALDVLARRFAITKPAPGPVSRGGLGATADGRSVGG